MNNMNNIRIIVSTAIINENVSAEDRIIEYKESFEIIKSLGYDFTIVETVLDKSDFLESYSNDVFYANVNGVYKNRGTNYVNAFRKFINNSNFVDDDIVIHITGRYPLVDDSFFVKCKNIASEKIGCFRKDDHGQFHLFLYALRFAQLKTLLNSIDSEDMERRMISLERIFADKISHDKIEFTNSLGIIGKQSTARNLPEYGKTKF